MSEMMTTDPITAPEWMDLLSHAARDLDTETLEKAAAEALEQPQPSAMWDERLYTTHGAIMFWAENDDDILTESNYLCVLAELEGVANQDGYAAEDDVIDAPISHWLAGNARQLFVRVRDEGTGHFTPTFCEATAIALALREYPVFDESDLNEREWQAYERTLEMAMDDARRDHADDIPDEGEIDGMAYDILRGEPDYHTSVDWHRSDDVDWEEVAEVRECAREAFFEAHAADYADTYAAVIPPQCDGQESLPI